jgi:hypothetical protein
VRKHIVINNLEMLPKETRESFVIFGLDFVSESVISILDDRESETLSLWQGDGWGLSVTDDNDVTDSGGELLVVGILDVDNIVGTDMLLDGGDNTNSSDIVTGSEEAGSSVDELDNSIDLVGGDVELDGISNLNIWMWESDGSSVDGDNVRNLVLTNGFLHDLAKLESGLLGVNSVWLESSLGVHENSEMLVGLVNGDDIHDSEWESMVSSDLSVDLDETFLIVGDSS